MSDDFVIAEVSLAKLEDFRRLGAANVRIGPVIVPVGLWLCGKVEFGANIFDPRVRAAIAEELRQTVLKQITDAWMRAAKEDVATIHALDGLKDGIETDEPDPSITPKARGRPRKHRQTAA